MWEDEGAKLQNLNESIKGRHCREGSANQYEWSTQ